MVRTMSKISIVGVEGSGKTTLMAAFGEKYERPDKYGYFLAAENAQTFHAVKQLVDRMRHGEWPGATVSRSVRSLDWQLCRRRGRKKTVVCSVSFLDYAGEIYRLAFGEHADEERRPVQAQINTLLRHIDMSDSLLVLINLKDVINGDLSTERTREMLWVSRNILDYASRGKRKVRLALAFSQADVYRETLAAAGGLDGAYRRYLGFIESLYPDMRLLAVSAVNRTVVRPDGLEVPAPDFESTELEGLLDWIVAPERRRTRIRQLKIAAVSLFSVLALCGLGSCVRHVLQERARDAERRDLEHKRQIGYVIEESDGKQVARWMADVLVPTNANLRTASTEGDYRSVRIGYEWVHDTFKDAWKPGFVVANGEIVADRREGEWKSTKPGFIAWQDNAGCIPQLVWKGGLTHPQNKRLKSGSKEGEWLCSAPGWKLTNGLQTVWQPGIRHPDDAGLVADEKEDQWKAIRPGYVWDGGSHAVWKPGLRYPDNPFVAGAQEGEWKSTKSGYVAQQNDVDSVPKLVWQEGLTHLQNKRLKSGSAEGDWLCVVPGWKWTGGSQTEWQTGVRHPINSELISDAEEDRWKATRPGYAWNGGSRVVWKPGTMDGGRKASRTPDEWLSRCSKCDGTGRCERPFSCQKCDGKGKVYETVTCDGCNGNCTVDCDFDRSMIDNNPMHQWLGVYGKHMLKCRSCNAFGCLVCSGCGFEGYCPQCGGNGKMNCRKCNGQGRMTHEVPCTACDNGYVKRMVDCPSCDGEGWR